MITGRQAEIIKKESIRFMNAFPVRGSHYLDIYLLDQSMMFEDACHQDHQISDMYESESIQVFALGCDDLLIPFK